MIRGSVLVPAVALLTTLVASPITADAATATAPDRNCTKRPYITPLSLESWKGKGDNKEEPPAQYGKTEYNGRTLRLMTSRGTNRSSGHIDRARAKDRVWIDITDDNGHNWQQCGTTTMVWGPHEINWPEAATVSTPWFLHSSSEIKNRWMRACMEVDGVTQCATNGNIRDPNGRLWWTDEEERR